jgi:putative aldouronate transport system substrate-binding protein
MSEEGTTVVGYGEKGIGWTDADPGATGPDGSPAKIKILEIPQSHPNFGNITWGAKFPNFRSNEYRNSIQEADDMFAPDGRGRERYHQVNAQNNYAPYAQKVENIVPPLYFQPQQSMEMTTLVTNINTYVNESIAKFIVGDMNFGRDWDTFQTNLNNLGLPRYLNIVQGAYDISPFAKRNRGESD